MNHQEIVARINMRRPPAWDLLGGTLVSYDESQDHAVMAWRADACHCHSVENHPKGGIVQGGVISGWLDAAMACACLFRGDDTVAIVSMEIKVSFMHPAHPGEYRSYGRVLHAGRSAAFLEADLRDSDNRLIARATSTAIVRPSPTNR